jgi:hypothetical protein
VKPTICRMVVYRSRTGGYDVPAVVNCTEDSISEEGVELGHVPPLTGKDHVHLTVFTPGKPGTAREGNEVNEAQTSGCYQEWDIPPWTGAEEKGEVPEPGTWRFPVRI